uniref:S1-like domain-containing protein n=1 Tax=Chromera velia CCMP2878 TaxID=1169474 RepID=A0A0G4FUH9_9ALVE|mmetsp:Transcript_27376/g.53743  ORF Transcript_27376/g.53743 Transcript_27376/m.53743 type:complete len:287 (-) Transcript_27376:171-1031(-)|eukprot:Cvel_18720.t1-p1 / transcript=Cvel_18720.t1 / gene=Cvel_18720 / organism=Chromera_velia_CCMP2878 / gene_product=Translation initiation factor IF-1, putative / transcript_product=Translation initiation factor IF-1, putative / location=Cvel_scaffold1569:23118-25358(-) / protein_length=286 / sequence_SO=supercontig / SO=protein_coding / is_pseudo=false
MLTVLRGCLLAVLVHCSFGFISPAFPAPRGWRVGLGPGASIAVAGDGSSQVRRLSVLFRRKPPPRKGTGGSKPSGRPKPPGGGAGPPSGVGGVRTPRERKARDDLFEMEGQVVNVAPGETYIVELDGTKSHVTCKLSGKLRVARVRLALNDRVRVDMSPYDLSTGRISYRWSPRQAELYKQREAEQKAMRDEEKRRVEEEEARADYYGDFPPDRFGDEEDMEEGFESEGDEELGELGEDKGGGTRENTPQKAVKTGGPLSNRVQQQPKSTQSTDPSENDDWLFGES